MVRPILWIMAVVLVLGCEATTDSPSPTQIPAGTEITQDTPPTPLTHQDPSIANLEARVREFVEAYEQGDWPKAWSIGSPRSREVCSAWEFVSEVTDGQSTLKDDMDVGEDAKFSLDVRGVRVEGDLGYVEGRVMVNEMPISTFGDMPSWVYLDGQWWRELEGWENGCK